MIHLSLLRCLQGHVRVWKIRTGVLQFMIEPEAIEIVSDIVVMMNIPLRTTQRIWKSKPM